MLDSVSWNTPYDEVHVLDPVLRPKASFYEGLMRLLDLILILAMMY
jgi:hypothetical protein